MKTRPVRRGIESAPILCGPTVWRLHTASHTFGPWVMQTLCDLQIRKLDSISTFPSSSSSKNIILGLLRYVVARSHKIKEKKKKCVQSKKWCMLDLPASASRNLAELIGLLEFCVTRVLVHVANMIHGNFGAMDPM